MTIAKIRISCEYAQSHDSRAAQIPGKWCNIFWIFQWDVVKSFNGGSSCLIIGLHGFQNVDLFAIGSLGVFWSAEEIPECVCLLMNG